MRNFHTSIVEFERVFSDELLTEPYEGAWANEAIFFVTIDEEGSNFEILELRTEISPDGLVWLDNDGSTVRIEGPTQGAIKALHFGGWLRLRGTLIGQQRTARVTVRLALKG